ncbi:S41 family peptidase [Daejeonella oryzae]|uniref:S41 family peptidase n=1 Tax=Daejeonella oryzae TaxID=1122943 RepID=UPI00068412DD|nr:S41 family peptidase [Daejeonella oryzae]
MINISQISGYKLLKVFFLLSSAFLTSCQKDPVINGVDDTVYVPQVDIRDSAYLYTKDIYLWSEVLPSIEDFRPRNSADIFAVMTKVRSYQPLDRFSFVEKKTDTDNSNQGLDTDFGFLVKFFSSSTDLRVNYVYQSSPAGNKGVKRGWKILALNGRALDASKQTDVDYLNDVFFGTAQSASFTFQKPDGTTTMITIDKGMYPLNTVLFKNVYTFGSKKIGYLVFNQFSGISSVYELTTAIDYFQSNGVNEMIVDLRYNRGGFVSTQDTLANMLAPQSVGRGQNVMYKYIFNQKYSSWNETTYFNKASTLNLSKIVFIVTSASASASELLINNLRPVMDVKLIGEKTFGKPVGFFPIPVFDYNIYPVSFKTVNSVGSADYYTGFPVDKVTVDDVSKDFGDINEASLKEALNYINSGAFTAITAKRIMSGSSMNEFQLDGINKEIHSNIRKIEIENRPSKMPRPIRDLQEKFK